MGRTPAGELPAGTHARQIFNRLLIDLSSEVVEAIIRGPMDRSKTVRFIRQQVDEKAPAEDRPRLFELVETEVMSLHEGNFARYHVTPNEYEAWRRAWR